MFCVKVYRQGKETLVAACDPDIVGKEFREGKMRLHVDPRFYGTDETSEEHLLTQLRFCTIANLVGENTVAAAIRAGFIDPANVLRVEGVPHAQLALF